MFGKLSFLLRLAPLFKNRNQLQGFLCFQFHLFCGRLYQSWTVFGQKTHKLQVVSFPTTITCCMLKIKKHQSFEVKKKSWSIKFLSMEYISIECFTFVDKNSFISSEKGSCVVNFRPILCYSTGHDFIAFVTTTLQPCFSEISSIKIYLSCSEIWPMT